MCGRFEQKIMKESLMPSSTHAHESRTLRMTTNEPLMLVMSEVLLPDLLVENHTDLGGDDVRRVLKAAHPEIKGVK